MRMGKAAKQKIEMVLTYIGIFIAVAIVLFPFIWMVLTSFKKELDILTVPPKILFDPTLSNYGFVFERSNIIRGLTNSLIAVGGVIAITIPVSLLAAYSFARFNVGGGQLSFYILTVRMFPPIAAVIPYFITFQSLGLLDNILAVIILNTLFNMPFTVWLLTGFIKDIPQDLEEAAMIEGATRFEAFREIILPLITPALAVAAVFAAMFTWNEFLFAFILTRSGAVTVTRVMAGFYTERGILWGPLSACATLCTIPMFILALMIQKYIIRGLTFGAVR
ncbi:MAG: carbohydrate ABC transporter permease [Candidatus Bathyarchaeia archaeon]